MSPEREVVIYGHSFRLKGDDPERLDRIAAHVDAKMAEILKGPGQGLSVRGAVLTALNITEEWFSSREEEDRIFRDLGERVDELLSLLPG